MGGSDTMCQESCKVTTHTAMDCRGSLVRTYSTHATNATGGKEWRWYKGNEENKPVSVYIGCYCAMVELYDEGAMSGGSDNIEMHKNKTTGCFNLPWDLKQDLGGLKVFREAASGSDS